MLLILWFSLHFSEGPNNCGALSLTVQDTHLKIKVFRIILWLCPDCRQIRFVCLIRDQFPQKHLGTKNVLTWRRSAQCEAHLSAKNLLGSPPQLFSEDCPRLFASGQIGFAYRDIRNVSEGFGCCR